MTREDIEKYFRKDVKCSIYNTMCGSVFYIIKDGNTSVYLENFGDEVIVNIFINKELIISGMCATTEEKAFQEVKEFLRYKK